MNPATTYFWTGWTTLAALVMYFWIVFNVGRARGTYKIKAPAMEGPPAFLSILRVHANTVEQMVLFLPALWLAAIFRGDRIAAACGAAWIMGRIAYAIGYYIAPNKRGPGFAISMAATVALMVAAATGLLNL
ncbi:MAG: MAPEG family protein [Herminiimonas sp.]|nr:MAPEG family protein [Herminiimonas sp.]